MNGTFKRDGNVYDVRLGFLVLSQSERRALEAQTELSDARSVAAAASAVASGGTSEEALAYAREQERSGWPNTLDPDRISVRLEYEALFDGPLPRDVPGFSVRHLAILEREMKLYRPAKRIARTIAREARVPYAGMPEIFFDLNELPAGVELSRIVDPKRREAMIVMGRYAYPVWAAWMVLPRNTLQQFSHDLVTWMRQYWPEALDLCAMEADRHPDFPLDREITALAAEAFARGLDHADAVAFIFEARAAALEHVE